MSDGSIKYEKLEDDTPLVNLKSLAADCKQNQSESSLLTTKSVPINADEVTYEEVAINVSNTDDPDMLCLTFRSVFVGILLTCLTSFFVQFFAYRTSPLDINIGIIALVSYLLGLLLHFILPHKIFNRTINPGPFTIKEHALIVIMASSGGRTFEGIEVITVQRLYYKFYLGHVNAMLYLLLMHSISLTVSGILRRYLVWPASMIWPKSLMTCSLLRTLINEDEFESENSSSNMKRSKFFLLMVIFQFLWYWVPGYICPILSSFSFICFFAPKNLILSQLTGANGLSLGAIELDWNAWVAYLDSPILVPFWAHVNIFLGFVTAIWIGVPIFYYLNVLDSERMPIISNKVFDKEGYFYNTTKVLKSNLHLNQTAYEIYGPMYLSAGYILSSFYMFAGVSALIIHTILFHGKTIVEQFRSTSFDKKGGDIHAKLMSYYPEVSDWWFYGILLLSFIGAILLCHYASLMAPWIMCLSIIIIFLLALPNSIITALTNMAFTTTTPSEILSSLIQPGDSIGFLTFRIFAYTCPSQILIYLTNFKIAHYMKIPPRIVVCSMALSAIISSFICYLTSLYLLNQIPNICTSKNPTWRCLNAENTHTSSLIFGLIGIFNPGSRYAPTVFGFLVGAILPVISWCLWKKFPSVKWLAFVNFPLFFLALNNIPPAPAAAYPSWFIVGFVFNYILYNHAHMWWEKYAYIFSAAMNCGVALCGFIIFFVLQNNKIEFPQWWGLGGTTNDGCPLANANISGITPTMRIN